jgi:type I restriction enzyme S subunit
MGGTWGSEPGASDVDVRCVRGTDFDMWALRVDETRLPVRSVSKIDLASRSLSCCDIVIERAGGGEQKPVGRAVLFDLEGLAVPTNFAGRLRPAAGHSPRYLAYLLNGLYAMGTTRSAIKQTTGIQNLDLDAFLSTSVTIPGTKKQREIAEFLDAETARIDALIEKKRHLLHRRLPRRYTREVLVGRSAHYRDER